MPPHVYWLSLAVLAGLVVFALQRVRSTRTQTSAKVPSDGNTTESQSAEPRQMKAGAPYELVRARFGWALANPNDVFLGRSIIEYGEFSEEERQMLEKIIAFRPGTLVEVGANAGFLTVPLAQALAASGNELIAFEPQPFLFQNLCANLALNGLSNVRAWPWACGENAKTLYFPAQSYSTQGNYGGVAMEETASTTTIEVPCVRLDDVVGTKNVSLIKIDVEGSELAVLKGAETVIAASRPIISVENDRAENSSALMAWLLERNYRLWWHTPPLYSEYNFFRNTANLYGEAHSLNLLCLPAESAIPDVSDLYFSEVDDPHWHPLNRGADKSTPGA